MAVEAPPAPPTPAPAPAPVALPPAKSELDNAFSSLESRAKPLSADTQPIPDHPSQKATKERQAREAEEAKKKEKVPAPDPEDDLDEPHVEGDEAAEAAKAEAARLEAEKLAKENKEKAPPKKKGDYLREELAKVKAERDTFKTEAETLKKAPRGEDPEKKTLQEKLTAMEKRQQEIEDEYRLHNYERSSEYREKFVKPYHDTYNRGRLATTSYEFTNPDGTTRPATTEDFDSLMSITNGAQAVRYAKEVFGDSYPSILHHRERVLEAHAAQQNALHEAKTTGAAKLKEIETQTVKQREATMAKFNKTVQEREQKSELLKEVAGDEAWNEAVARGKKMADRTYLSRDGKTPEEQADIDAANYVRARAYSPLKLQTKRLKAEVDELKKELAKYKNSEPGNGQGRANHEGTPPPPGNALDGVFANIEAKGKPASPRFH